MISRFGDAREHSGCSSSVVAPLRCFSWVRGETTRSQRLGRRAGRLLGFYVYYPARVTLPVWLAFLVLLGLRSRRTFPVRRLLLVVGSIAVGGFVLMVTRS